MRKYYHIYVNSHNIGSAIIAMVMMSIATLAYAGIVELYMLDTIGTACRMWISWHEFALSITGETGWYLWVLASPFFTGLLLAVIAYNMPDIKLFRRQVPLAD